MENEDEEIMVNTLQCKTLPALKFNRKLGIQKTEENVNNEPSDDSNTETLFQTKKLPPLKNNHGEGISHISKKKKKRKKKAHRLIDTVNNISEDKSNFINTVSTTQAFELNNKAELDKHNVNEDNIIENNVIENYVIGNKNATTITNVQPIPNNDDNNNNNNINKIHQSTIEYPNIPLKQQVTPFVEKNLTSDENINASNNSNVSTDTYIVNNQKENLFTEREHNPSNEQLNNLNISDASTSTFIVSEYLVKKEEPAIKSDDEETQNVLLSEESSTNIVNRSKDTTTVIQQKPDYRKIALDLAVAPRKLKDGNKRLKRYCDFVLVHDLQSDDIYKINERLSFEKALQNDGLDVVKTVLGSNVFVEIYASFERLCKEAESIHLHMDLEGVCSIYYFNLFLFIGT